MVQCKGTDTCKRPAVWRINLSYDRPYVQRCDKWQSPDYCKIHAEQELARLQMEMPDEERQHRHRVIERRWDAVNHLSTILYELRRLNWAVEGLENGRIVGNSQPSEAPDPAYAARIREALKLASGLDLMRELETAHESLKEGIDTNLPRRRGNG